MNRVLVKAFAVSVYAIIWTWMSYRHVVLASRKKKHMTDRLLILLKTSLKNDFFI